MLTKTNCKYTEGQLLEGWGLDTLNAGYGSYRSGCNYPLKNHPNNYRFSWNAGRTLNEYQLIYIHRGSGFFESASVCRRPIREGSIFAIFPGEWHRYRPNPDGWDEFWVGFCGELADMVMEKSLFSRTAPILEVGRPPKVLNLFHDIWNRVQAEAPGYQQSLAGEIIQLLGELYGFRIRQQSPNKELNTAGLLVSQAKEFMAGRLGQSIQMEELASELNTSYSQFRKLFKQSTGFSPGQYFIQLKVERAKQLLQNDRLRIKEVAYALGFECCFYFSKLFKEKAGMSPESYRKLKEAAS